MERRARAGLPVDEGAGADALALTYAHLVAEGEALRAEYDHLRAEYEASRPPFSAPMGLGNVWRAPTVAGP